MTTEDESRVGRMLKGSLVVGVVICSYLIGSYTTKFEAYLYPETLDRAFQAIRAYNQQSLEQAAGPEESPLWVRVEQEPGVVIHRADEVQSGYTLWSAGRTTGIWLIDMEGEVVHEWDAPWRKIFKGNHPHVEEPVPASDIGISAHHIYPDGDLLVQYGAARVTTPYGYGFARIDKNSEVVWAFPDHAHHDADVVEGDDIWALTHQFRDIGDEGLPGYERDADRVLEDFAVRLSPDGEELERVSILQAVSDSEWRDELLDEWFWRESWDPLHTNNLEVVGADFAEHHPFAEPDHLLVCFRTAEAIGLVDPDREKLVWATDGFWSGAHDPDPRPDGQILLYDNLGYFGVGGPSRIVQFNPANGDKNWSYSGSREHPFYSYVAGKQTVLENGNILFNQPDRGRLYEVTRSGDVVWEYHNPMRITHDSVEYASSVRGTPKRVDPQRLTFEPQGPIGDVPILKNIQIQ